MTSWIEHVVRRWRLKKSAGAQHQFKNQVIGKLPNEWQIRMVFWDLVKVSPIMEVVEAILATRQFDELHYRR